MNNRKIKNENQIVLFNLIQKSLPKTIALVDEVSELLGLGSTATYRRIRGDKPISLEETIKLCQHFNISMDSLVGVIGQKEFKCKYVPESINEIDAHINFMQTMSKDIENHKLMPKSEIILSATDIPAFNFLE